MRWSELTDDFSIWTCRRRGPRTSCRTWYPCRHWRARSSPPCREWSAAISCSPPPAGRRSPASPSSRPGSTPTSRPRSTGSSTTCEGPPSPSMAELGVLPHVIEAIVNHVSGHKGGVAGIYNRAVYMAERKAALELWADRVSCHRRWNGDDQAQAAATLRDRIIDKMPEILKLIDAEHRADSSRRRRRRLPARRGAVHQGDRRPGGDAEVRGHPGLRPRRQERQEIGAKHSRSAAERAEHGQVDDRRSRRCREDGRAERPAGPRPSESRWPPSRLRPDHGLRHTWVCRSPPMDLTSSSQPCCTSSRPGSGAI